MKINKEMGSKQQHLGMMEMILVAALMMDMLIVMLRSQLRLFLNLDRFVGLSTCLSHTVLPRSENASLLSLIYLIVNR